MGIAEDCARAAEGLTIPMLMHRNATEFGDLPALTALRAAGSSTPDDDPGARTLTWAQLRDGVAALSRGLAEAGLAAGDRMLIMMSARPQHWLADLAAVHLGAVPCSAYDTLSSDQLHYLGRHSKAPLVVLEGADQLARWLPILDDLPDLRTVLVLDESAIPGGDPRLRPLRQVADAGRALHAAEPEVFEKRWREIRPDQPVTLLYTSGTTGDPKGVLISHHNVIYQSFSIQLQARPGGPEHPSTVSYLPLAHIAERMLGVYVPIHRAGHVHIAADPRQVVSALTQVRPAGFFGVPRVWEKLVAGWQSSYAGIEPDRRAAVDGATALALRSYRLRAAGDPVPDDLAGQLAEADRTVLRPIRALFGLDDIVMASSGAAPIPVAVLDTLAGLGIDTYEVWGMTETTGSATVNTPDAFRPGTVGRPGPGMEIRIAPDGEVLVRGPLVGLGYLRPDGGVEPVTDAEGWLATGDVGALDDGFLSITDRKKELIITSSGKNIPPARIEGLLRVHPLIGHAAAIGDRRNYVTALITLDEEATPAWAAAHGIPATGLAELAAHPAVLAEIDSAVQDANTRLARIEQIKRYRVLPRAWSPEDGELTPTLKLRRRIIDEHFHDVIEELYR